VREPDERDLRAVLRAEADRHQPDRDAMLQRIVATRGEQHRTALVRLRPLAAAAGVAAVLGVSIAGVRLASSDGGTHQVAAPTRAPGTAAPATTPSPPPSSSPASSATRSRGSAAPGGHAPPSSPPSSSPSSQAGAGDRTEDGFLSSEGLIDPSSNPYYTQSNVVLHATRKITGLDVTITVQKTAKVVGTEKWSSVPRQKMTLEMTTHKDTVVFHFVLNDGETLAPGEYTFSAQFNHAENRSAKADTYTAATTAGKTKADVAGGF
jgi:hypothetical protein